MMASRVSSSYQGSQKLCLVLLLLLTLASHLQVVHGKNKKRQLDTKVGTKKVRKRSHKNDEKRFFNLLDEKVDKEDNTKDTEEKNTEEKEKENKEVIKQDDEEKDDKEVAKKSDKVILVQEVEEEICEYDYDLEFPAVDREFTEEEQKGIMMQFQKTYNSIYTELVVLEAEVTDQVYMDGGSRNLRNLAYRSSRYCRMSMRARAAGPNTRAKRPLFDSSSKRNRVLLGPAEFKDERFFEEFAKNTFQYTLTLPGDGFFSTPPGAGGINATLIHTADSAKKPEEGFFSFKAKMVLKYAKKKLEPQVAKEIMKDFQKGYNDMFWNEHNLKSLVVEVKRMKQLLKRRPDNTTDVVCIFNGTMYTNFANGTDADFDDFRMSSSNIPIGTKWRGWWKSTLNQQMILKDLD